MKTITEYIYEASDTFKYAVNTLKYEQKEPKENQEDYIQIMGNDKHFWNTTEPIWVKVSDLGKYTTQEKLLSVAYNLCKTINNEITNVEIGVWDQEDKAYITFAIASLQKRDRMWHPEYIKSNKYPFK